MSGSYARRADERKPLLRKNKINCYVRRIIWNVSKLSLNVVEHFNHFHLQIIAFIY